MKIRNFKRKFKTLIIAEIGINHGGNIQLCKKMITAAKNSGADAVKLQSISPDNSYMRDTKSYEDFKNKNFNINQLKKLQYYCKKIGILFFTTPGDIETLFELKPLNLNIFKISSGLFNNIPLIEEILKFNKPIILSTGMAKKKEIDQIYKIVKKKLGKNFALLKCTANYPCKDENVNISAISSLSNFYDCEIGYSDHTLDDLAVISAVSNGASIIEKHFTIDNYLDGGDNYMSMLPQNFKKMVDKVRRIENMIGSYKLEPANTEIKERNSRFRFLVTSTFIDKSEKINIHNVNMKRVANYNKNLIPAVDFSKYRNKRINKAILPNTVLKKGYFD